MAARDAYENAAGLLVVSALRRSLPDVVIADLPIATILAEHGIRTDVLAMGRATQATIHEALDDEVERTLQDPGATMISTASSREFVRSLRRYRASARDRAREASAIQTARLVVAPAPWIGESASRAGAQAVAIRAPAPNVPWTCDRDPRHADARRFECPSSKVMAGSLASRASSPQGAGPLRVLAVGPLVARLGARILLEAAQHFGPSIELTFSGRVAERPDVLAPWAALFRSGAPEPFWSLLARADVVLAPWIVDGYSFEVAEAVAAGIPVFATPAAGAPLTAASAPTASTADQSGALLDAHTIAPGSLADVIAALSVMLEPRRPEVAERSFSARAGECRDPRGGPGRRQPRGHAES